MFTYDEISIITNQFNKPIGCGGFGEVHYVCILIIILQNNI